MTDKTIAYIYEKLTPKDKDCLLAICKANRDLTHITAGSLPFVRLRVILNKTTYSGTCSCCSCLGMRDLVNLMEAEIKNDKVK